MQDWVTPWQMDKFMSNIGKGQSDDCWEWKGARNKDGYGLLYIGGKHSAVRGRLVLTHRLSYSIFKGGIPEGLCVLHDCDNPPCCNPNHLYVGDNCDNVHDAILRGRHGHNQGDRSPQSKLTEAIVRRCRVLYKRGLFDENDLAWIYGVNPYTMLSALKRRSWRQVH